MPITKKGSVSEPTPSKNSNPWHCRGFETLAENLVRSNNALVKPYQITVYCSSKEYPDLRPEFLGARLKYIPLPANGKESILYDFWSLVSTLCSDVEFSPEVYAKAITAVINRVTGGERR